MTMRDAHIVENIPNPQRISDYLPGIFEPLPSRNSCKKALKKGLILLNGEKAASSHFVAPGDIIHLQRPANCDRRQEYKLPLNVLYEDDHLACVYKPAGIVSSGNKHRTLDNALLFNLGTIQDAGGTFRPRLVHRLDYATEGAILAGKTGTAVRRLNAMFEHNDIRKEYMAVVSGNLQDAGSINKPIDGKSAKTFFEKLYSIPSEKYGQLNLVRVRPETGRRHQIRQHFAFLAHPVMGDKIYGSSLTANFGKGMYLFASRLAFRHPVTSDHIDIRASWPRKYLRLFDSLKVSGL